MHAEMIRCEGPEYGHDGVERREGKQERGGKAWREETDAGPHQTPNQMHCRVDRVEPETERKAVGIRVEAIIGIRQENNGALGQEIDAQPAGPDNERDAVDFDLVW